MKFSVWLLQQTYRKDLIGELAEFSDSCPGWPKGDNETCYRVFLHTRNASPLLRQTFSKAFEEWQVYGHLPAVNVLTEKKLGRTTC